MVSNMFEGVFSKKKEENTTMIYIKNVYYIVVDNISLFLGMTLSVFSLTSFMHGRECDGTTASHFACTNPSVYYYYPLYIKALLVIGLGAIIYWFLKRELLKDL